MFKTCIIYKKALFNFIKMYSMIQLLQLGMNLKNNSTVFSKILIFLRRFCNLCFA